MNTTGYTMATLLKELVSHGYRDATRRKIRFLVERKLIPPPSGEKAGARYGEGHLLRILAIWKLRKTYWKIDDIRNCLEKMSPEDVRAFALSPEPETPARLIEDLNQDILRGPGLFRASRKEGLQDNDFRSTRSLDSAIPNETRILSRRIPTTPSSDGSRWERFEIQNGVELNIREDAIPRTDNEISSLEEELQISLRRISRKTSGFHDFLEKTRDMAVTDQPSRHEDIANINESAQGTLIPAEVQRFECDDINGHILAVIGEQRVLLDTAFPSSFGECQTLTICGKTFDFPRSESLAGMTSQEISALIETRLTVFLGSDILTRFDFVVDLPNFEVTFAESMDRAEGLVVPIRLVNGIPTVSVKLPNGEFPFFVSTGSKLSYVHSSLAEIFPVVGTDFDYIPRIGKFETKIRRIPITLGEKHLKLTFGVIPILLEEISASQWGVMGTLGAELFAKDAVMFSNSRSELVLLRR